MAKLRIDGKAGRGVARTLVIGPRTVGTYRTRPLLLRTLVACQQVQVDLWIVDDGRRWFVERLVTMLRSLKM